MIEHQFIIALLNLSDKPKPGMDIKDCPTALDNWKYLSDNWNSHPTCPTGQVKFEPSFMLKEVVGTENPVNEYQTKNVGRWIFSLDKWNLQSLVRQDKPQNKLMSNPANHIHGVISPVI